jgi:hypothetical protein
MEKLVLQSKPTEFGFLESIPVGIIKEKPSCRIRKTTKMIFSLAQGLTNKWVVLKYVDIFPELWKRSGLSQLYYQLCLGNEPTYSALDGGRVMFYCMKLSAAKNK